jgi:polysaccharide biosynthesis transport protein
MEALPPVAYDPIAEANPREYWRILVRRKWVVLFALVVAAAGSLIYTWRSPRQYAASSKVYVRKPEGFLSFNEYSLYSGQINPNTQIALIKTSPVIELALAELKRKRGLDLSVDGVANALNVDTVPNTELIDIGVQWPDPQVASDIANAMATGFVQRRTTVARNGQEETLKFLRTNVDKARRALTDSEAKLQRFEEQTHYAGSSRLQTDPQQAGRLTTTRSDLLDARIAYEKARIELQGVREQLARQNELLASLNLDAVRDNALVTKTRADLVARQRELLQARAQLTDEGVARFNPGLKEEVAQLQEQLNRQLAVAARGGVDLELQQTLAARLPSLETDVQASASRVAALQKAADALEREQRALPALARRYSRLLLDKEANEKMYTLLRQKQKETEISRIGQMGNAEVVESATPRPTPVWPRPRQNLAFALAFGLMLGIAAAFLCEFLDDSLATPEDIERYLHLPTLGSIPMIKDPSHRLLTQVNPRSGLAEGYRMIRSSVTFSSVDAPLRTIMVTSAGPGEGKSMMAANLAIVHAQKGIRVLLVDCDLRRPCQQKLFHLSSAVGYTNLVVGSATVNEATQGVGIDNLRVISSGPLPPNPAEMLDSARSRQVMEELKQHADLVIFDTPPCAVLSDPVVLSTLVDGVLLVIESGETNRNAAAQAAYHLAAAKANLLGAILNKVDQRREGYHSYYYHQQYYRSYYTEETLDAGNGTGMLAGPGPKDSAKTGAGKRGKGSDEG